MESREGFDHLDSRCFRNLNVLLGRFPLQGPLCHDVTQNHCAGVLTFEHIGAELFAQTRAQVIELLTLLLIEILRQNRLIVDLGQGTVIADHAVVRINTGDDETRNHENHRDKHQPTFVCTEYLKEHNQSS